MTACLCPWEPSRLEHVLIPQLELGFVTVNDRCVFSGEAFRHLRLDAAAGAYRGILQYCDDPVVSTDLCGNAHSSIFDVKAGMQTSEGLTKLIAWYDNEWGYANRTVELARKVGLA